VIARRQSIQPLHPSTWCFLLCRVTEAIIGRFFTVWNFLPNWMYFRISSHGRRCQENLSVIHDFTKKVSLNSPALKHSLSDHMMLPSSKSTLSGVLIKSARHINMSMSFHRSFESVNSRCLSRKTRNKPTMMTTLEWVSLLPLKLAHRNLPLDIWTTFVWSFGRCLGSIVVLSTAIGCLITSRCRVATCNLDVYLMIARVNWRIRPNRLH